MARVHKINTMTIDILQTATRLFFEKGYSRVIAGAFEENPASIKVMKKSGMRKIKKEEDIEYRGRTHHCLYYAIDKI